ncbi:MAG: glycyl-radical enzyme activating protein [Anaerolineae bacterium]|nr:glycyl-radical enzyme activating protein [Anaerolineae bacterium]
MVEPSPMRGLITNVQRFSIHDGPGIRTTVFLKGCPLRCFWCHNPETWRPEPEVQFFPSRCIGCGACLERCPQGVHALVDGQHTLQRTLCRACGRCVETCYAEALVMCGRWWGAEELLAELLRDRPFYEQSEGGITLSGGEPLLQQPFSLRVLQLCKQAGLHTAVETAAVCRWRDLAELLPWTDLLMVDLKHMDDARHRSATGASNRRVLANLRRIGRMGVPLVVRTPVVPGVNDTPEAVAAIAGFVRGLPNLLHYELMAFHRLAGGKYQSLGLANPADALRAPSREAMDALAQQAREVGVREVRLA